MNINHGLLPPVEVPERDAAGKRLKGKDKTRAKKRTVAVRALADIERWLGGQLAARPAAE
jgi:methylenetetrahydrofolate--tRNA-(uracil-5-)-methyltransferase